MNSTSFKRRSVVHFTDDVAVSLENIISHKERNIFTPKVKIFPEKNDAP